MHIKEKDFPAFLDNSLPPEKKMTVKQHLSVCKACSMKLAEWESLFDAIGEMESDFELDGMEDRILLKIKEQEAQKPEERAMIPVLNLVAIPVFLFILSLFMWPLMNIAGLSFRYAADFLLNEGIDFINSSKWQAVDIIASIGSIDLSAGLFPLFSGVILIAGGAYFSLRRKAVPQA